MHAIGSVETKNNKGNTMIDLSGLGIGNGAHLHTFVFG